jgi:plastocyanin
MRKRLVLIAALAGLAAAALASFSVAAPRQAGQKVAVTLKEYTFLGAPAKLKPGATEFTFANKGKFEHNFTIIYAAQGTKFRSRTLAAGKTQRLTVNLQPGSYIAVCTVFTGYHASLGMVKRFTVGKIDFKTGKWGS